MIPTWVAVVTGISLAILAVAAIVIAAASVVAALGLRVFLRMLHELAGPAAGGGSGLAGANPPPGPGLGGTARGPRRPVSKSRGGARGRGRAAGCRVRGGAC